MLKYRCKNDHTKTCRKYLPETATKLETWMIVAASYRALQLKSWFSICVTLQKLCATYLMAVKVGPESEVIRRV